MALTLLATTDTQIIRLVEALYNQRPGYTYLSNFQAFVTENSVTSFANALGANFASSTDAELAAIVTGNIGLTGDALTAGNTYLEAQFAANSAARGNVILVAMNALSTLTSDATYGAAATLYNADVAASLVYSQVAANTTVTTSDAAADTTGTTFALTTSIDTGSAFTGTSVDDTFNATHLTFNASDSLVGGAGTDTLTIVDTGTAALTLPSAIVSGIENINIRNLNTSTAVAAVTAVTAVAQVTTVTISATPAGANGTALVTYGTLTQSVITGASVSTFAAAIVVGVNALAGAVIATSSAGVVTITAPVAGTPLSTVSLSTYSAVADSVGNTIVATTPNTVAVAAVAAVLATTSQTDTVDATNFTDATTFVSDNSTGLVNFTGLTAAQAATMNAGLGGMGAGFGATVTAGTVNISGGTTAGDIVITGAGLLTTVVNSTGAANTIGVLTGAASNVTSTTINATTALTTGAATNLGATLTITGAGKVDLDAAALEAGVTIVDASTATGGVDIALGSLVTQTVTGSTGDDLITSGAILTTGTVNAGAGTDTLVIGTNVGHANTTTLGGKYTNFETIRVGDSFDMANFLTATGVEINAMTNKSITGLTATQAANVTVLGDQATGVTLALAAATGTSDALTMTMGTGLTTGASFDLTSLTVTGFETVNLVANPGPTASVGASQTVTVSALVGATLSAVNLTGSAFAITAADTTVAVAINGSALTGDNTVAGALGLAIGATTFTTGSTVTGSAFIDSVILDAGTEGVTLSLGAGVDSITADVASLVANGVADGGYDGGAGIDTLTVTDTATTLTDNHFTNVSNMEKLTLNATGATSLTSGSAFNSGFSSGITITQASKADGSATSYALGLSSVATTIVLTTAENGSDTTATNITTGSAADTVTVTASSYIGAAVALDFTISTGAGADTITYTTGTLADAAATANAVVITGGTGADTITKTGVNGNDAQQNTRFVIASGDSTTTAWDKITGYDMTASGDMADGLDFAGTAAVGTLGTSTDSGTILSHVIAAGVATFDDAATHATALIINSANLADVVGYLAANTATNMVVAFTYDTDSNGAADATMVYHNGAIDSLVQLTGITTADAVVTTNVNNGTLDIFIV